MNSTKVAGWLLLILGLAVIAFSLYSSWQIFTGKGSLPEIFKLSTEQNKPSQNKRAEEAAFQEAINQSFQRFLPVDAVTKTLNLLSWSILAGIFIFGGAQISGLGIKLLKS